MLVMINNNNLQLWVFNPQSPVVKTIKPNILKHYSLHALTLKNGVKALIFPVCYLIGYYHGSSKEVFLSFLISKTRLCSPFII